MNRGIKALIVIAVCAIIWFIPPQGGITPIAWCPGPV